MATMGKITHISHACKCLAGVSLGLWSWVVLFTGTFGVIGCASTPSTPQQSDRATSTTQSQPAATDTAPLPPMNQPAGSSQSMQVVAGVMLLGLVPYDNMMLPLVSPDGRYVATQCGAPPSWPTVLAEQGAEYPSATRVEIYELDLRENIKPEDRQPPELIVTLAEPVLLGRSCDAFGFLVESQREDGTRWIGKVEWKSGTIDWLVNGPPGTVNAFAAMGPGGRLAWSRRSVDGGSFELVVWNLEEEFTLRSTGGDWTMPVWSGRGNGLFVFLLTNGVLDLRYGNASSEAALRQSLQRLSLTSGVDMYMAYQSIIGQPDTVEHAQATREQIVFFHPGLGRVAVWRPLAASDHQGIYLNAKSVAALVDQEEFAFVSTDSHLLRQNLRVADQRLELVGGPQIPRATPTSSWPYMLLSPGEGHVGFTAMRLLPRTQSIIGSGSR